MSVTHMTLTISPQSESDWDLESYHKFCISDKLSFLTFKHVESGHVNWHTYFRSDKKIRSDNFRRKFTKFLSGDSLAVIALRVTDAYSLQQFINYVYHEPTAQMLATNLDLREIDTCIANKKVFQKLNNSFTVLTPKNSVQKIVNFCRLHDVQPVEFNSNTLLVQHMLDNLYTFVAVRGKLDIIMSEVRYHLTKDVKYITAIAFEVNVVETHLTMHNLMS